MVNHETGHAKAFKVSSNEKEWLLPKINLNVQHESTIVIDTYQGYVDLKKL